MIYFLLFIPVVFLTIQVLSLVFLFVKRHKAHQTWDTWPEVTILLAARDEEKLIIRSLESIEALEYPKDKLQVLIGDDRSCDDTYALISKFIANKPNYTVVPIIENLGKGRGKANVLAQLAHLATGQFYFITDVDVQLPTQWIKGLLLLFTPQVGIVSGTTMCEPKGQFATLQAIDWLHFMGYIKAFANVGISCTSVGNNMAVRREAYWQTGGFEKMTFSITEDYRLFKEVTQRGWEWRNALNSKTLGKAWAIESVVDMLHQRKRWLIGAQELPLNWKILLVLYGLFLPAWLVLLYANWQLALLVWGIKFLMQTLFIQVLTRKVYMPYFKIKYLYVYEVYVLLNTLLTGIFYFLPLKTIWKRRAYSAQNLAN